jgi:hypothetical protein
MVCRRANIFSAISHVIFEHDAKIAHPRRDNCIVTAVFFAQIL